VVGGGFLHNQIDLRNFKTCDCVIPFVLGGLKKAFARGQLRFFSSLTELGSRL
jgi:hypothetical protein